MKQLLLPVFAFGLMTSTQLYAQTAEAAVEAAAEAVEDAAKDAMELRRPPAPPPISVAPIAAPYDGKDKERITRPRLIDYSLLDAKPADYPPASWVADEEGTVEFEVTVNTSGDATSCRVLESSGYAALDAKTCETAVARGKFEPGTDETGVPVEATYRDRQIWNKREPEFPGTATIHVAFVVGKDGVSRDCEVIEISGEVSERMRRTFDREPCPGINRPARAVYRDENGNPISKRVELQVIVKAETIEE
ncbi:energy transducer TonB [Erythrobacter sp. F6033]|uniref:energy transducer TonB n=1 Tax=Erythrobacter sp. F6033 TaxID=2926401 RepID=UPI001FF10E0E|nr:energy transducer TonB [Erythrobacter sp. F6033]MCK0128576.1 energy transducer TonB [Erythrobacter sp. F6033]